MATWDTEELARGEDMHMTATREPVDISAYTREALYAAIVQLGGEVAALTGELDGLSAETQSLLKQKAQLSEYISTLIQKLQNTET